MTNADTTIYQERLQRLGIPALQTMGIQKSMLIEIVGLDLESVPGTDYSYYSRCEIRVGTIRRRFEVHDLLPAAIQGLYLHGWKAILEELGVDGNNMNCHRVAAMLAFPEKWQEIAAASQFSLGILPIQSRDPAFWDGIIWRNRLTKEIRHSAVLVVPGQLVWSKNGRGADHPVCLQNYADVDRLYRQPQDEVEVVRYEI